MAVARFDSLGDGGQNAAMYDLPAGYAEHRSRGRRLIAPAPLLDELLTAGFLELEDYIARRTVHAYAGRRATPVLSVPGGERMVLRRSARGGWAGPLLGDRHLNRERPLCELAASARARAALVPTPEILAVLIEPVGGVLVRFAVGTRELEGARELLALQPTETARPSAAWRSALRHAGAAVRRLHEAGVAHGDLHPRNLLVVGDDVHIIDLDRAGLFDPLPAGRRWANLRRLQRAAVKLAFLGRPVARGDRFRFLCGYEPERLPRRALLRELAPSRLVLAWHRALWRWRGTTMASRPLD